MYVNMVDDLFDGILNKFNIFLSNEKAFTKLNSDTNFVKFQNDILSYIKKFIESISKKDIIETYIIPIYSMQTTVNYNKLKDKLIETKNCINEDISSL